MTFHPFKMFTMDNATRWNYTDQRIKPELMGGKNPSPQPGDSHSTIVREIGWQELLHHCLVTVMYKPGRMKVVNGHVN